MTWLYFDDDLLLLNCTLMITWYDLTAIWWKLDGVVLLHLIFWSVMIYSYGWSGTSCLVLPFSYWACSPLKSTLPKNLLWLNWNLMITCYNVLSIISSPFCINYDFVTSSTYDSFFKLSCLIYLRPQATWW